VPAAAGVPPELELAALPRSAVVTDLGYHPSLPPLLVAAEAQAVAQRALATRIANDVLIDRLVADADAMLEREPAGDLLGTPAQMKLGLDERLEGTLDLPRAFSLSDATEMRFMMAGCGLVRLAVPPWSIASNLTGDRRRMTTEGSGDLSRSEALAEECLKLVSLIER